MKRKTSCGVAIQKISEETDAICPLHSKICISAADRTFCSPLSLLLGHWTLRSLGDCPSKKINTPTHSRSAIYRSILPSFDQTFELSTFNLTLFPLGIPP
jgi:hypothetical protein